MLFASCIIWKTLDNVFRKTYRLGKMVNGLLLNEGSYQNSELKNE